MRVAVFFGMFALVEAQIGLPATEGNEDGDILAVVLLSISLICCFVADIRDAFGKRR